jgi:glycosyltransferase domain-containing protein
MPLSDITIVILSKGREKELLRSLKYWDEIGAAFLVLHNTDDSLDYFSTNVKSQYIVSKTNYGTRCGLASQKLASKYGIICADDEIFLPSALAKMCETLEENQDIQSVGGQTIAIGKYGPIFTATQSYSNMTHYENKFESSQSRLEFHFNLQSDYKIGAMYRLMRTEILKNLLDIFSQISTISTPYIYQVTGEVFVTAIGKSLYVKDIFWIRNWLNKPVVHTQWNRKLYFYQWLESAEYEFEVKAWMSSITKSLAKIESDSDFVSILPLILVKQKKIEMHEKSKKSVRFSFLDENIKYWIKKFLPNATLPEEAMESINSIPATGVLINMQEFQTALNTLVTEL